MSDLQTKVLIVDDQFENIDLLVGYLESNGYSTAIALNGEKALELMSQITPDIILLDILLPGIDGFETCRRLKKLDKCKTIPVLFLSAITEAADKVQGFKVGGVDYITKPIQLIELEARITTHLTIARQKQQLTTQNSELINKNEELQRITDELQQEIAKRKQVEDVLQQTNDKLSILSEQEAKRWGIANFIGKSNIARQVLEDIRSLQDVDRTSVLILGESGTGKELIARAIHFGGTRKDGPFIPINSAAVPDSLAESTFFGHVKGSFSGAINNRQGLFELANGGTLFLDEITDMPLKLQAKILRSLETGMIMPVGSDREKYVDVRIISASNANIQNKISSQDFRSDLYYRLARFTINLPPLRERCEDIPLLAEHFLQMLRNEMKYPHATISPSTLMILKSYHYPGNIRELKNIIENGLIRSRGGVMEPQHINTITKEIPTTNIESTILDYTKLHGSINNSQCRSLLNISFEQASHLLGKMQQQGLLKKIGQKRWSKYQLPIDSDE